MGQMLMNIHEQNFSWAEFTYQSTRSIIVMEQQLGTMDCQKCYILALYFHLYSHMYNLETKLHQFPYIWLFSTKKRLEITFWKTSSILNEIDPHILCNLFTWPLLSTCTSSPTCWTLCIKTQKVCILPRSCLLLMQASLWFQ